MTAKRPTHWRTASIIEGVHISWILCDKCAVTAEHVSQHTSFKAISAHHLINRTIQTSLTTYTQTHTYKPVSERWCGYYYTLALTEN